jgi:hypothetical protein
MYVFENGKYNFFNNVFCFEVCAVSCTCALSAFVLACFQASAAPRPKNSDSEERDPLFGLVTQITISKDRNNTMNLFYS